jgi:anti-sigma regulatory factor (Ser/Thr protein kinase)
MAIETRRGVEGQSHDALKMRFGSGPGAAASARGAIAELRTDLDPPLVETLRLLVTELVTNSVRHTAADSVMLSIAIGKSAVLTEVADTGPGFDPRCVEHSADEDTGWGLFLVERLSDRWGVRHDGPSKRVWFELRRA